MNHKNSAYQRGASRQQPQPQSTPSVAAAPAQKSLPGWLWLACGMIIGTCTVFLMNLNSGGEAAKAPEATVAPAGSAETAPAQIATQADEQHKPKYDFYTLLPDSKVILPPNMEEEVINTAPPPAAVPSEADRAEAALAAGSAAAVAAAALAHKATDTPASQSQSSMALKPPVPAVTVTTNTQPKQPPAPPVVKPTPVAKVTPPPVPSTPVAKVAPPPVKPDTGKAAITTACSTGPSTCKIPAIIFAGGLLSERG